MYLNMLILNMDIEKIKYVMWIHGSVNNKHQMRRVYITNMIRMKSILLMEY